MDVSSYCIYSNLFYKCKMGDLTLRFMNSSRARPTPELVILGLSILQIDRPGWSLASCLRHFD